MKAAVQRSSRFLNYLDLELDDVISRHEMDVCKFDKLF
ncbi:hypothetical protein J2S02_002342 [Metabacillus niabensis]|uniref:Uncharacterized protein n=1 Tax=Metabacillus niabensis TaxID=324854 RepID=A0ABT9Z172_9BACI|nr:hypothetical protein [Metabacillus niabensis]